MELLWVRIYARAWRRLPSVVRESIIGAAIGATAAAVVLHWLSSSRASGCRLYDHQFARPERVAPGLTERRAGDRREHHHDLVLAVARVEAVDDAHLMEERQAVLEVVAAG